VQQYVIPAPSWQYSSSQRVHLPQCQSSVTYSVWPLRTLADSLLSKPVYAGASETSDSCSSFKFQHSTVSNCPGRERGNSFIGV
jgi:hypothetical protein